MEDRVQMAVFGVSIKKDDQTQPALMAVYIEDKAFEYTLFTHTDNDGDITVHVMNRPAPSDIIQTILSAYRSVLNGDIEFNTINIDISDAKSIHIMSKIDGALTMIQDFLPIKLTDKEYTASARTLQQYVSEIFTIEGELKDIECSFDITTFAARKDNTDYNLFWNSDKITAEEKAVASPELNMDIFMSNYERDTFKIVNKILTSKYAEKLYTAISLHGNPAGGKTEMIKAWCAFNHVPLIYIPCDPRMTIDRILSQIGPVTNSEGKADLVKTESLLFKCLRYNLPAVVFFDEANLMSTEQQNALAPIISEGNFKDGPNIYHNNFTIKWVLAYNPNTTNAKSFDGKFYDRLNFVSVEDVDDKDRKRYRARKLLASMISAKQANVNAFIERADKMSAEHPEQKGMIDNAIATLKRAPNSSLESLEWAFKLLTNTQVSKAGDFKGRYLEDVTLDKADKIMVASNRIHDFVRNVNMALMNQTKGKDTKNPDRSAYFYIADRAIDTFSDYIYSYRNVEKATHRIIMDLVPGGFTVRGQSVSTNALTDPTPQLIADTIVENLAGKIAELNSSLFNKISKEEVNVARDWCKKTPYIKAIWEKDAPVEQTEPQKAPSTDDDKLFDELEDLKAAAAQ